MSQTLQDFELELREAANPEKVKLLSGFFKTDAGSYGEGDIFIGITVPANRAIARRYLHLSPAELQPMLQSPIHELRLGALLCMVEQYKNKRTSESRKQDIFDAYIANTRYINNWDLVDLSAAYIVGAHLLNGERSLLYRWAESDWLWEQRISIVSTWWFIRNNQFADTLAIAEILCNHPHDLIQKAVGWMLREVGKRELSLLLAFLDKHHKTLPRTLLRYAIEKLSPEQRAYYMAK